MTPDGSDIRLVGDHLGAALCLLELETPGEPASFRIDYANDAAGEAWRTPVEGVVGWQLLEAFPALADTDLPRCFASLVAEQRTATVDGFYYPGDERVESGSFSFEAFPVGAGRLAIVFERVGDGAPSAWHLRQLAAIVDSSSDAIISKTLDGTITSWNGAAERMYGYTREETVGRPIDLIVPDDRRKELQQIFDALRRDEHVDELHTARVRKGGRADRRASQYLAGPRRCRQRRRRLGHGPRHLHGGARAA